MSKKHQNWVIFHYFFFGGGGTFLLFSPMTRFWKCHLPWILTRITNMPHYNISLPWQSSVAATHWEIFIEMAWCVLGIKTHTQRFHFYFTCGCRLLNYALREEIMLSLPVNIIECMLQETFFHYRKQNAQNMKF